MEGVSLVVLRHGRPLAATRKFARCAKDTEEVMARRESRHYLYLKKFMAGQKEISVFVDESGSFDASDFPSPYYIVCFLFHDQAVEIEPEVDWLRAARQAELSEMMNSIAD